MSIYDIFLDKQTYKIDGHAVRVHTNFNTEQVRIYIQDMCEVKTTLEHYCNHQGDFHDFVTKRVQLALTKLKESINE